MLWEKDRYQLPERSRCFSVMFILWAHLNRASKTFLVTALTTTSPLCHHNLWSVVEVVIKILLRLVDWIVFLFNSLFNFVTKWRYINFSFDACLLFALSILFCVCSCNLCSASSHCIGNICSIVSFILIVPSEAIFSSFFCRTYFQCTCCLLYGCTDSTVS